MESAARPLMLKFGPYLVDLAAGEVRKNGSRIRLQEKPLRVLAMLAERHGQLVTREELQKRLWPEDTFVDFETGLNTAVSKLRDALSDSAENPRYIETIPRRGYRFLMPVEFTNQNHGTRNGVASATAEKDLSLDPSLPEPASPEPPRAATGPSSMPAATDLPDPDVRKRPGKKSVLKTAVWIPLAAAVVLASLTGGYFSSHRTPKLTERDTIVLADFGNSTGDAIFDGTLKTALNVSLRQSPFLNLLSDGKVTETLQQMTLPAGAKLTPAVTREVCQRAGSTAYIAGSIANLGSEYVLELRAVNCRNGETLAQQLVTAPSKEKILNALGDEVSKLRTELGESLATVQKYDVPLEQATTPSLEALQAYSLGIKSFSEKGPVTSLPYQQRAVQIDPKFALGYWALGDDYGTLGETGRASEYFTKAFELREHASERERLTITGIYYLIVTGELDKAARTYQEEIESYPWDPVAFGHLGVALSSEGQYEKAVEVLRQALRLAPDQVGWYENLATYVIALQHFDEARQIIRDAQARKLDGFILHNSQYALAFLAADSSAMAEQQLWFAGNADYENFGLALASDSEAYGGHLARASELTKQAVQSAIRADNKENGATYLANNALQQAAFGNAGVARQSAAAALKLSPGSQGAETEAALAFAMAGDTARAESLAQDLGKRFPRDTQMQSLWLPAIRSQLALDKGNTASAVTTRQPASPIELGNVQFGTTTGLYHAYVWGQVYLASGQASAAAAEFQKIIDHSGVVWNCWTGALAHLGVARANALQSRTSQGADAEAARRRARAAYKDFLTLWKDADSNIPILKQAKSEYAKLQ